MPLRCYRAPALPRVSPPRVIRSLCFLRPYVLSGREAYQNMLVQRRVGNEMRSQVQSGIEWTSSNPTVVVCEESRLFPRANGTATVTARVGAATATAKVTVTGMDESHIWSFRNHVQSVLAKQGCNSGACHGALAGKGGFKLSLRGYDTLSDFHTITRQARGRRIEPADPGRSLLLAKPTGALPHKGGLRFEVDSPDYRVLAEWIAAGAAGPTDEDPRLERLEVFPPRAVLDLGEKQQVLVQAHYSDGRVEDVTRWAKFASADEAVATVDESGAIKIVGFGEGAVTAWFASRIATSRVTAPYKNVVPAQVFNQAPRRNFIDDLVLAQFETAEPTAVGPGPRTRSSYGGPSWTRLVSFPRRPKPVPSSRTRQPKNATS